MNHILIQRSPTADTRTCDFSKVSKDELEHSSRIHISDVGLGLAFFADALEDAAENHDFDKLTGLDQFHADFQTGFQQTTWWDNHRKVNRHHLNIADGVPADVNLVDVIEHVVDCVMAGMARSGSVYPLVIPDAVLQRAFANTVDLLKRHVVIDDGSEL